MSTIADYLGRKVDIMAFQGVRAVGSVLLSQALFDGQGGSVCTGIQKLAQRWTLEFLTEQGSLTFLPQRGSTFMTTARQGSLRTETDVFGAFLIAKSQIGPNLRAEEAATDPLDERYGSCTLNSVEITADYTIVLNISVVSLAGTSRAVVLPISVVPGGVGL